MAEPLISQTTVVAQVMARLKELIASGKYKPGDRLPSEQELAAEFGVGRSSIREAIKAFQHLGVLTSRAAKGTFVCERSAISTEATTWAVLLGGDDMKDILELRQALEEFSYHRLKAAIDRETVEGNGAFEELQSIVEEMEASAARGRTRQVIELDYRFHQAIVGFGDNRLFLGIWDTLRNFLHEEIRRTYNALDSLEDSSADHREILDSLKTDSMPEAEERHKRHFDRIKKLLTRSL